MSDEPKLGQSETEEQRRGGDSGVEDLPVRNGTAEDVRGRAGTWNESMKAGTTAGKKPVA